MAGTISTYTPLLGIQGVIGVKSGFTTAAGGCDVIAVVRTVHGQQVLLLAAVTGQQGAEALAQAGLHGLALVDALGPLIGTTQMLPGDAVAARVHEAGKTVGATTASAVSMLTWPGVTARRAFHPERHAHRPGPAGRAGRHRGGDAGHAARGRPGAAAAGRPAPVTAPADLLTRVA